MCSLISKWILDASVCSPSPHAHIAHPCLNIGSNTLITKAREKWKERCWLNYLTPCYTFLCDWRYGQWIRNNREGSRKQWFWNIIYFLLFNKGYLRHTMHQRLFWKLQIFPPHNLCIRYYDYPHFANEMREVIALWKVAYEANGRGRQTSSFPPLSVFFMICPEAASQHASHVSPFTYPSRL